MMNQISQRRLTLGVAATLLFSTLVLGLFGLFRVPAVKAQDATTSTPRTITVVGEGKVSIKPDMALATIGVEVIKPTVKEASAENKATIAAVLEALKAQGIAEKDIQTSGFSIYAERYNQDGASEQIRYHVSNNVSVVIRNLDKVGDTLDAAIEAGANNIYGVNFSVSDPTKLESETRAKAIDNAKAKAADLAKLTGVTVGDVVSVSEVVGGNGGGVYQSNFAKSDMAMGGGGATPVNPGELELSMQLQVVYSIAE
ncbi:MAG: SIMPL domain-containing protein [Chloroflexi bacterium]|nr:SIMPL domain-containing protein [Chloroflexota bacterium]